MDGEGGGPYTSASEMAGFLFARPRVPARCPSCGAVLYAFEWEGVELDRCGRCGGTWLDAGEMETIARLALGDRPVPPLQIRPAAGGPSAGPCPRCGRRLRPAAGRLDADPQGAAALAMPRCPAGHGIWLEPGQLRAALDRFTEGAAGAIARRVMEICRVAFDAPDRAQGGS